MIHVATDNFLFAHNDSDVISSFIEDYQQFAPILFEGLAKKHLSWNISQSEDCSVTTVDQCDYITKLGQIYNAKPLPTTKTTPLQLGTI